MKRICGLIGLLLLVVGTQAEVEHFTLCEMNVENLYDCRVDGGHDDGAFLPHGGKRWTPARFRKKLQMLSKTLISMGREGPPEVIALEEVENDTVITALTRRAILRRAGYRYTMTTEGDERGMNVALLYEPERFKLLLSESIAACDSLGRPLRTRRILHVVGRLVSGEKLHVFVCHFSSRIGGRQATSYRTIEGEALRKAVAEVMRQDGEAKIIVVGDFNEGPTSEVLSKSIGYRFFQSGDQAESGTLYNLSTNKTAADGQVRGTYKYDGHWEMIDQCLVNVNLLTARRGLCISADGVEIHAPAFLLETDPQDLGLRPRRTYEGYRYRGGVSDHLPTRTSLRFENKN